MSSKKDELISNILQKRVHFHHLEGQTAVLEEEKETLEAKLTAAVKASIEGNNKLYGGHNDGK